MTLFRYEALRGLFLEAIDTQISDMMTTPVSVIVTPFSDALLSSHSTTPRDRPADLLESGFLL